MKNSRNVLLRLSVVAALLLPVACSGHSSTSSSADQSQGSGAAGAPAPQATNTIAFPLLTGSSVLGTHVFHQVVSAKAGSSGVLGQGAGTYDGNEVVAGTQEAMPALETWLHDQSAHPPAGFTVAASSSNLDAVRSHVQALGLDFAVFQHTVDGKVHGLIVLAVDPKTLDQKAGPALGMIGKFKMLPAMMRDPIDAQAKKQTGFTLTEMTQPDTPIGAAVDSLDKLRDFGGRGIVLIDAVKQ